MSPANLARWTKGAVLLFVSTSLVILAGWGSGAERVWNDLLLFPTWGIGAVLLAFALNLAVVSYRLERLLSIFGIHLPVDIVSKASVQGHFAALFLISLFGQVSGRQWILRHYGVPSVFIATLTAIERIMLFAISGGMCVLGVSWLIGFAKIIEYSGRISAIQLVMAVTASLFLSHLFGRSRFEQQLYSRARSKAGISRIVEIAVVTLIAQTLVLLAFVVAAKCITPEAGLAGLLAAAAITSFAASLPISVNGWGVRELAAVYAFGLVGVPSGSAMAVSILVGMCSSAVVFVTWLLAFRKLDEQVIPSPVIGLKIPAKGQKLLSVEKIGAFTLSTGAAVLIFFQLHLPLPSGVINLNLADPFALFALAALVSYCVVVGDFPAWRVPNFNSALLAISILLVFAFAHGVQVIGVTQWAFSGRLIGWLVLLGYLSLGPLTVAYLGRRGVFRFIETLVVTGAVVEVVHMTVRWLAYSGWIDSVGTTPNFEGYAGNRNSFAFQMLVCSVLLLSFSSHYERFARRFSRKNSEGLNLLLLGRQQMLIVCHGAVLAGVAFSASRAGLMVGSILITTAWFMNLCNRRMLIQSIIYALLIWFLGAHFLPSITGLIGTQTNPIGSLQSNFSSDNSNFERWETILHGVDMWIYSPWIGAGLGVFIESSSTWFKQPMVIHSTPIWILAEFGLVGVVVFFAVFLNIGLSVIRNGLVMPLNRAVFMLFLVFAIFGLFHEIFYQRIFWLVLGILVALPFRAHVLPGKEK
jgi:hypothetical protein